MVDDYPVLITEELTKQYGELVALDRLSIVLERGEILGFIGPNGAGKTTAIRILVGQARPTSGSARIDGFDCVRDSKRIKRLIGYMPDTFGAYDNMRVHEYLDFFGAAFKLPRRDRIRRIDEVLELTGSEYMRDRFVESLSHGMKQRLAIARTLLHDPDVLILDEPANGLDPQARIEMRTLLVQLAEMGKALMVTSHILPELSRICDRVAIILQGRLQAVGSLEEIMRTVHERRVMEVELIAADQIPTACKLIAAAVEPDANPTGSTTESVVRFHTALSEKEMADLLSRLVAFGIGVSQFRELSTDLEETFLSITQASDTNRQVADDANRQAADDANRQADDVGKKDA